ncbi:MAG: hypothetical protein ABUL63_02710, partial [Acidobacteriota bacterium]
MLLAVEGGGQDFVRREEARQAVRRRGRLASFLAVGRERRDTFQRGESPERSRLQGRGGERDFFPAGAEADL